MAAAERAIALAPRQELIKKLKVYAGGEHPHQAQQPQVRVAVLLGALQVSEGIVQSGDGERNQRG